MVRKVTLIILTLIAFYYCMRFGYIWTAYGHGGQIAGFPFALVLLITTISFMTSKTNTGKNMTFSFGIIFFLTLAAFSVTIEIIRSSMDNYFAFLYYEPGGYVNKIFLGWLLVGATIFFLRYRHIKRNGFAARL